jgi:hypothetical protein
MLQQMTILHKIAKIRAIAEENLNTDQIYNVDETGLY